MQKILNISLSKVKVKPVFEIVISDIRIRCLLDTGADMPIWCGNAKLFAKIFPDAKGIEKEYLLSGFGKIPEKVNIYKIPKFTIKGIDGILNFESLYVAISHGRNFGCDLVLSAAMFKHMNYSIINNGINAPILQIEHDKDTYYTALRYYQTDEQKELIYSFTSEVDESVMNKENPQKMDVD